MKVVVSNALVLLFHIPLVRSTVFLGFEHLDSSHAASSSFPGVYMKPYSPIGDISCGQSSCVGEFQADLSSDSSLKFQWSANKAKSKGITIDVDPSATNSVIDFEFNAGYDCNKSYYQYIHGTDITWSFDASSNGKYAYDPDNSLIEIGTCDGCTRCEIFIRLRFNYDGGLNMNFISLTAEANYDNTIIPSGPKVYDWTTAAWSNIRFRYLSLDDVSFSTYDLPTTFTAAPTRSPVRLPTEISGPPVSSPTQLIVPSTNSPTQSSQEKVDLVTELDSTSGSSNAKSSSFILIGAMFLLMTI